MRASGIPPRALRAGRGSSGPAPPERGCVLQPTLHCGGGRRPTQVAACVRRRSSTRPGVSSARRRSIKFCAPPRPAHQSGNPLHVAPLLGVPCVHRGLPQPSPHSLWNDGTWDCGRQPRSGALIRELRHRHPRAAARDPGPRRTASHRPLLAWPLQNREQKVLDREELRVLRCIGRRGQGDESAKYCEALADGAPARHLPRPVCWRSRVSTSQRQRPLEGPRRPRARRWMRLSSSSRDVFGAFLPTGNPSYVPFAGLCFLSASSFSRQLRDSARGLESTTPDPHRRSRSFISRVTIPNRRNGRERARCVCQRAQLRPPHDGAATCL